MEKEARLAVGWTEEIPGTKYLQLAAQKFVWRKKTNKLEATYDLIGRK